MSPEAIRRLLEAVRAGDIDLDTALERLRGLPFEEIGDGLARVDHHRPLRAGTPEVVLGEWKSGEAIGEILASLAASGRGALATRVSAEKAAAACAAVSGARYEHEARAVVVPPGEADTERAAGRIAIVAAGTSDASVAAEAATTAEFLGHDIWRIDDVGVAGLPRVLAAAERARAADALVVVAGMEGALPSVLAGLVDAPIVAVPTSVGYGVGAGGLAALAAMLASCAPGVTVVNIDNGFGGAVAASRICRARGGGPAAGAAEG